MLKIKVFDCDDEHTLTRIVNDWIDNNSNYEIKDIKFQVSIAMFSEEQIYCFSAMIMYDDKIDSKIQKYKERIEYLERSIERKEDKIRSIEDERVPYTNEYVDRLTKKNKDLIQWLESKNKIELQQHRVVEPVIKVQEVLDKIKESE